MTELPGQDFVFAPSEHPVTLRTEVPLLPLLVTRMAHRVTVRLLTLHRDFRLTSVSSKLSHLLIHLCPEYPLQVLLLVLPVSPRTLGPTADAGGAVPTVPPARWYLGQSHAVDVKASVAEVTEQHLILVLRLVALHALLTVGTLPLVAGDELGEVNNCSVS